MLNKSDNQEVETHDVTCYTQVYSIYSRLIKHYDLCFFFSRFLLIVVINQCFICKHHTNHN